MVLTELVTMYVIISSLITPVQGGIVQENISLRDCLVIQELLTETTKKIKVEVHCVPPKDTTNNGRI